MRNISFKILIITLLLSFGSVSCHKYMVTRKQDKALKEAEKRKEELAKEKQKKYEEAVKAHASHQSKKTKKMMKQTYSQAEKHNYNKKDFFLKRWFTKKSKKTQTTTPKVE